MDEQPIVDETSPERKPINRWLIVAIVAAVAAGILLASSVWTNKWTSDGNSVGSETVAAKKPDPQAWCAAQSTYDNIRRELFRRAAQVRGSDDQAYTRLADFAALRMDGPVVRGIDDQLNSVTCGATAVLDLPPGVNVPGGRRSLSGDVDYMVQPAADGTGNVVRLGNADSIVIPLATLSRGNSPQSTPLGFPPLRTEPDRQQPTPQQPAPDQQPAQPRQQQPAQNPPPPARATASPSFDCDKARTYGEIAVCGDSGLASLDRQMASQFNSAMNEGEASQRHLLRRTRGRFLSYRDHCATNQCIADSYRSRMREISDIMADRWRG